MTMKRVAASLFKTRCLKLLDEVAETGEPIVITKRGRPVARVIPERVKRARPPSCKVLGDIVSPIGGDWDVDK
jgi:prevent-host-death family protein